jgi:hypothetical protein
MNPGILLFHYHHVERRCSLASLALKVDFLFLADDYPVMILRFLFQRKRESEIVGFLNSTFDIPQ